VSQAGRLSAKSLEQRKVALCSLIMWNHAPVPKVSLPRIARVEHEPRYMPSYEDIRAIFDAAKNPRDKALVLFLPETGQRVGLVAGLRYYHVAKDLEAERYPLVLEVEAYLEDAYGDPANKLRAPYRFFVPTEAAIYLQRYIKTMREDIDDDDFLFAAFKRGTGGLSRRSIECYVRRLVRAAGLWKKPRKIGTIHSHVFRRWFNTQLTNCPNPARLNVREFREFVMGHMVKYEQAYLTYTPEKIREFYYSLNLDRIFSITGYSPVEKVGALMDFARAMGLDPEFVYKTLASYTSFDQAMEAIKRKIAENFLRAGALPAEHAKRTQIIVDEVKVEVLLARGYEAVMVLPSGKVILRLP